MHKSEILTSQLYEFDREPRTASKICIKYVINGEENYQLDHSIYTISPRRFLLLEQGSTYTTHLSSKQLNEGICFFIDREIIRDVVFTLSNGGSSKCLDNVFTELDTGFEITEGLYRDNECAFGQSLAAIGHQVAQNGGRLKTFNNDHLYGLIEQLVCSQRVVTGRIRNIAAKKPSVQKELYRRIEAGRNYMNDNLTQELTIDGIANAANLSPFHFMRTFKQVYSVSPYQYLLDRRLQHAYQLNELKAYPVSEIAILCGFTDIFTFSRAFKKKFGKSPKLMQNQVA